MNTLDDLRNTLGQHADGLDDRERYIRPVAVRARIRVVRRRRTASVAVAAVLAVAATAVGVGALRQPDGVAPASSVVGVDVPRQVSVTGFPYVLSQTAALSADTRLRLESGDRAVSLAGSGLGDGSATLYADGEPIARTQGADDLEVPVPTGATVLRVRLNGTPSGARAGVAVYGATGGLADGVVDADETAVFRTTIGSDRLLAGAFSDPGRSDVRVSFTGSLSDVRFSDYCSTDEEGLWLNVEIDDMGPISGPCRDYATNDPGTSSSSFEGGRVRDRTVHAYLTRGADGPVVGSDSTVVGVAVYRTPVADSILGMRVASTVEYAGRLWTLDRVVHQSSGDGGAIEVPVDTSDGDRLVGFIASGRRVSATWTGRLEHGGSSSINATGSAGSELAGVLFSGDSYDVRLASGGGEDFDGALLVYRPE